MWPLPSLTLSLLCFYTFKAKRRWILPAVRTSSFSAKNGLRNMRFPCAPIQSWKDARQTGFLLRFRIPLKCYHTRCGFWPQTESSSSSQLRKLRKLRNLWENEWQIEWILLAGYFTVSVWLFSPFGIFRSLQGWFRFFYCISSLNLMTLKPRKASWQATLVSSPPHKALQCVNLAGSVHAPWPCGAAFIEGIFAQKLSQSV